jgi:hypothetical protein
MSQCIVELMSRVAVSYKVCDHVSVFQIIAYFSIDDNSAVQKVSSTGRNSNAIVVDGDLCRVNGQLPVL